MANLFKSYTKSNVGTVATVYTVPASTTSVIIGLTLSNTTASPVNADVIVDKSIGDTVYLAKNLELPDGTLYEFNAGNKIILETGDQLQIASSSSSSIDVMVSVLEQT
jgi:hypothetical protein